MGMTVKIYDPFIQSAWHMQQNRYQRERLGTPEPQMLVTGRLTKYRIPRCCLTCRCLSLGTCKIYILWIKKSKSIPDLNVGTTRSVVGVQCTPACKTLKKQDFHSALGLSSQNGIQVHWSHTSVTHKCKSDSWEPCLGRPPEI